MVVYLAFCTANGKTYVGQTKKKFETRKTVSTHPIGPSSAAKFGQYGKD